MCKFVYLNMYLFAIEIIGVTHHPCGHVYISIYIYISTPAVTLKYAYNIPGTPEQLKLIAAIRAITVIPISALWSAQ